MNKICLISLSLSVLALAGSVLSFFKWNYTLDMGTAVAILCILVTLLVGWQILTTLDIKKEVRGISNMRDYVIAFMAFYDLQSHLNWLSYGDRLDKYSSVLNMAIESNNCEVASLIIREVSNLAIHNNLFNLHKGSKAKSKKVFKKAEKVFGIDVSSITNAIDKSNENNE